MAQSELDDLNILYNATREMTLLAAQHERLHAAAQRLAACLTEKGPTVQVVDETSPEKEKEGE